MSSEPVLNALALKYFIFISSNYEKGQLKILQETDLVESLLLQTSDNAAQVLAITTQHPDSKALFPKAKLMDVYLKHMDEVNKFSFLNYVNYFPFWIFVAYSNVCDADSARSIKLTSHVLSNYLYFVELGFDGLLLLSLQLVLSC